MTAQRITYQPGTIVMSAYWGSCDRILKVEGREVTCIECDRDGTPKRHARVRTHCTPMDRKDRVVGTFALA